jgi:hypothetical protein
MPNIKIEFTSEFNAIEKGEIKEFSKDICKIFVDELKVANYYEEEVIKPKAKKVSKTDKKEE